MMNREELLEYLINNHTEIHDYMISMQFLSESEDNYTVTTDFLLNKSFGLLTTSLNDLGIIIHDSTVYENYINLKRLSDLYLFISHTNLISFLNDEPVVHKLVEGLLEIESSSMLMDLFDDIQVIFLDDIAYTDMKDLVFSYLTYTDKFKIYISNILKIIAFNTHETIDNESVAFYIKALDTVEDKIIQYTNRTDIKLSEQSFVDINNWFSALCNSKHVNIFGWYLKNRNDVENQELITLDFEAKYMLLKKTTVGYREYYVLNNIEITKEIEDLIMIISKLDPFVEDI